MPPLNSKLLFLTTSPRTPEKMIPEIALLARLFSGKVFDNATQRAFMEALREEQYFHGTGENDPAFSARDRIMRAPKSLGFVALKPVISLTPAGEALTSARRKDEVLLRQLLKFQVPSPFHRPTAKAAKFCVKPYLELLRLVRTLGTLTFDELQLFGLQLTDWHRFGDIVEKIKRYRTKKATTTLTYRKYKAECLTRELRRIYRDEIASGKTKTRESNDQSIAKMLRTKGHNCHDYADAAMRYLRATGLVAVSHTGHSMQIAPERADEVDFILNTVPRNPVAISNEPAYIDYIGQSDTPTLLTDNPAALTTKLQREFPDAAIPEDATTIQLKDILADCCDKRKAVRLAKQTKEIKDKQKYDEIQTTFDQIAAKELYDAPLMLEWNIWRTMTMLDGGDIRANLTFDDYGLPLATAAGNKADIVCDYGDFCLAVEVTLQAGQRQYETEGEPVARHLGRLKADCKKPCYCLFVAPTVNEACIAHFYTLQHLNLNLYGGTSTIVPITIKVLRAMLEASCQAIYTPKPEQVKALFEASQTIATNSNNEQEWYDKVTERALAWPD